MLTVKFKKTAEAVYISHIDVQNAINRTVRRADYEPNLSGGYNPHTLLKLSPPLPLGIESLAEYFTLYLDGVPPADFVAGFNANAPHGLEAIYAVETKTYPNLAGNIVASDYIIRDKRLCGQEGRIAEAISSGFVVKHKKAKDETIEKNVSELIYSYKTVEEGLAVRLASGNTTLRADRFAEAIGGYLGFDVRLAAVVRTAQFVAVKSGFEDVDLFLAKQV